MADQGKWFKLWCSCGDDPDLANLSLEDFGRWCKMGMYLKMHGSHGVVSIQPPAYALQQQFRVSSYQEVLTTLCRFPHCIVDNGEGQNPVTSVTNVTVTWSNWLKYQGDFSGDRVRKMRALKRSKRRGEEKRREENKKSINTLPPMTANSKPEDHNNSLQLGFPQEDAWLKDFLATQQLVSFREIELTALLDPVFWDKLAIACHGIDRDFLEQEFAKIGLWLIRNPKRRPTRRFISNWLCKAGAPQ